MRIKRWTNNYHPKLSYRSLFVITGEKADYRYPGLFTLGVPQIFAAKIFTLTINEWNIRGGEETATSSYLTKSLL